MVIQAMLTGSRPDRNAYASQVDIEETSYAKGRGNQLHLAIEGTHGDVTIFIEDDEHAIKLAYIDPDTHERVHVRIGDL